MPGIVSRKCTKFGRLRGFYKVNKFCTFKYTELASPNRKWGILILWIFTHFNTLILKVLLKWRNDEFLSLAKQKMYYKFSMDCLIQLRLHRLLVKMVLRISTCPESLPVIMPPSGYRKCGFFTHFILKKSVVFI